MAFGLACLVVAFVTGAWMLERRARRRLAARNDAMRTMLDTIQEGLVTVDANGAMSSERSAILGRWFGPVPAGAGFAAYLRPHDARFADAFDFGLDQLRAAALPLELAMDQMPRRFASDGRVFAVTYEPMRVDGRLAGLLVAVTDITAELERERTDEERRDLLSALEHARRDRSGFGRFMRDANALVERIVATPAPDLETLSQLLHTLKGNAAQFGISSVARICHTIEGTMADTGELGDRERKALVLGWQSAMDRAGSIVAPRDESAIAVTISDYEMLVDVVRRRRPHDEILRVLGSLPLDIVQARLERLADHAAALATRLGKPVPEVTCRAHGLRLDESEWGSFWAACVHLVRNAVDHGIESPDARAMRGKPAHGRIVLEANEDAGMLVVRIADDGGGIDASALWTKAEARGIDPSDLTLADLLFAAGSSRDVVTEVSGRGFGMAAVAAEVRLRGGTIAVETSPARGTTFVLRVPLTAAGRSSIAPAA